MGRGCSRGTRRRGGGDPSVGMRSAGSRRLEAVSTPQPREQDRERRAARGLVTFGVGTVAACEIDQPRHPSGEPARHADGRRRADAARRSAPRRRGDDPGRPAAAASDRPRRRPLRLDRGGLDRRQGLSRRPSAGSRARVIPATGSSITRVTAPPEHWDALRRYGPCPEHRLSYRGVVAGAFREPRSAGPWPGRRIRRRASTAAGAPAPGLRPRRPCHPVRISRQTWPIGTRLLQVAPRSSSPGESSTRAEGVPARPRGEPQRHLDPEQSRRPLRPHQPAGRLDPLLHADRGLLCHRRLLPQSHRDLQEDQQDRSGATRGLRSARRPLPQAGTDSGRAEPVPGPGGPLLEERPPRRGHRGLQEDGRGRAERPKMQARLADLYRVNRPDQPRGRAVRGDRRGARCDAARTTRRSPSSRRLSSSCPATRTSSASSSARCSPRRTPRPRLRSSRRRRPHPTDSRSWPRRSSTRETPPRRSAPRSRVWRSIPPTRRAASSSRASASRRATPTRRSRRSFRPWTRRFRRRTSRARRRT